MGKFNKFEKDMNLISALPDEPNDVGGLTADELKRKFDEGGLAVKEYINEELLPGLEDLALVAQNGAHVILNKSGAEMQQRPKLIFYGTVRDNGDADTTVVEFTARDVGAVPTSRTVNGKALSSNIALNADDVGARSSSWFPTAAEVGAVPTSRKVNNKALSSDITLSATDVSAVPTSRTVNGKALSSNISLTAANVGAVPTTRTVNGQALSADINLTASDVSAVPTSRTVNGKALSSDISLTASNVGAVPTSRTVNSKALTGNITLGADDVGAVPTSRTVNSKALTGNITLGADDVGAVPTSRTVNSKALSSNITLGAEDVDAEPRGLVHKTYSASTNAAITSALNDAFGSMQNGTLRYIRINVTGSSLSLTTTTWTVLVCRQSDTTGFAVGYSSASNTPANALNTYHNGGWIGWGYANPNGNLNTAYRTTERFIGKPVYTKVISLGTTADKATFDTQLTVADYRIIRFSATLNGTPLPYHYTDTSQDSWIRIYEGATYYTAMLHTKDVGLSNSHLQIWYCER